MAFSSRALRASVCIKGTACSVPALTCRYQRAWPIPNLAFPSLRRNHSAFPSEKMASNPFFDAIKTRRSYYALNNTSPIPDSQIEQIVKEAVLHVPSSFNSQSARLVLLLKKDHERFWDLVRDALKPMVSAEHFPKTEQKLNGFKAGYGTVRLLLVTTIVTPC
jgi:hypothetical protein